MSRWRSTSAARPSGPRPTPSTRRPASETPDDFRGQVELIREVLDALQIRSLQAEGYEADDVIATLAVAGLSRGHGRPHRHRRPRCAAARQRPRHRADDPARDQRHDPVHAERGRGEVRPDTRRSTPTSPRCAATRATTCPSIPGVGEKTAAKWIREFGSLDALVDRVDEVPGKAGDALRTHLGAAAPQPPAHRAAARRAARPCIPSRPRRSASGTARRCQHALFDTLQFRVLRERLYATLSAVEPERGPGLRAER